MIRESFTIAYTNTIRTIEDGQKTNKTNKRIERSLKYRLVWAKILFSQYE